MIKNDKTGQLSVEQLNAIDLLILGKRDAAVAEAVGVSRQTVCEWRNHHPVFQVEMARRRAELWEESLDRLRALVGLALEALADDLSGKDPEARRRAALAVLRLADIRLTPPSEADAVRLLLAGNFRR